MSNRPDPLDAITVRPRTFGAILSGVALVAGLALSMAPVRVSTPDATAAGKVSCGNTLGGVDTPQLSSGLGGPDRPTLVAYVDMCERAIEGRALPAWTLFFCGMVAIVSLGVIRRADVTT